MNAAAFVLLAHAFTPAHLDGRPTETCPADVVETFDRLDDAMRHLDEELDEMRGRPHERDEARQALVDAVSRAQMARQAACRAARVPVVVAPPPPARVIVVLDDVGERNLVNAVRKEPFDDARLSVLALGVRGVCVTSAQARDLVGELTFSRARIDAVRALAPRILDRAQAYSLLDAMTFESDKRAVREVLTTTAPAPECVDPRVLVRG